MRRTDALRAVRVLLVAAALLSWMPQPAFAHLGLRSSVPAEGAHLAEAPRELRLTFTEAVTVAVARLRLVGPDGAEVPLSPLRHANDSAQVLVADVLGSLEGGVYRLDWQVIGRDGHPVRGTIAYVVAPGATRLEDPEGGSQRAQGTEGEARRESDVAAPHHDPVAMPSAAFFGAESPGFVVVRALQFMALLAVIGALAFALVVLRLLLRTTREPSLVKAMRARAAQLGAWAAALLIASAFLRLYAQSLALHGPADVFNGRFMAAMLTQTGWGRGWIIQVVGALAALGGFAIARRGRSSGWVLAAIAGAVLAATPALSGHAAAANPAVLAIASDTLHVIGAAGWLGSLLFVLGVGIPSAMALGTERRGAAIAQLVNAFSPTALGFAGLTVATGLFASWLHIGFSSALWTSDYGRTLLIKLGVLSLVLLTGAYNWRRVKPALGDDAGTRRIRRSATVELAIAVLVVVVTAVLVATPPPVDMASAAARP